MATARVSQCVSTRLTWRCPINEGRNISRAFATHSLHTHPKPKRQERLSNHSTTKRHFYTPSVPLNSNVPGIYHTLQGHSSTITVSNALKLNILNSDLLDQLIQTCHTLSKNESLRAVVLTGGPTKTPTFIGGADIKEMHSLSSLTEARKFIEKVHSACQSLRDLPVPVIAKIDGLCLGAGLEIAASCDFRIATEKSSFAMPEVRIGIPSVVEAALLPGLIGMGRTRRLLYLAETIGAVEAERWGLVERVVSGGEELERAVEEWVGSLVEMAPKAIRSQKRLMLGWENQSVDEGIQAGVEAFAEAFEGGAQEPRELMGRFVNRKR